MSALLIGTVVGLGVTSIVLVVAVLMLDPPAGVGGAHATRSVAEQRAALEATTPAPAIPSGTTEPAPATAALVRPFVSAPRTGRHRAALFEPTREMPRLTLDAAPDQSEVAA